MDTVGQMIDRILRAEDQQDTNDTNTRLSVMDALNEAQRGLCTGFEWNYLSSSATATAATGDEHISLPADFIALFRVTDSAGGLLHPRELQRQLTHEDDIVSCGKCTYAMDGVDANGQLRLRLCPASDGDTYTFKYQAMPATFTAESQTPAGPIGLDDYLVRAARMIRLEDDEAAEIVVQRAAARLQSCLAQLARSAGQPLRALKGAIVPLG